MAGTIHQAMAYLGLASEENVDSNQKYENRGRRTSEEFIDYDEDLYDYEDEQLETHELEARQDLYAESNHTERAQHEPAHIVAEVAPEPVSSPFERIDRKLAEAPAATRAEPVAAPAEAVHTSAVASSAHKISSPKPQEKPAPALTSAQQVTNDESEDQLRQITTIHPRSYNDAKIIGESFRENIPVIMNVTEMSESEAKRLVDFSAGLAFALHGSIERVTDKVFLLTPTNLEVLAPEGVEMPVAIDADASHLFNQG